MNRLFNSSAMLMDHFFLRLTFLKSHLLAFGCRRNQTQGELAPQPDLLDHGVSGNITTLEIVSSRSVWLSIGPPLKLVKNLVFFS